MSRFISVLSFVFVTAISLLAPELLLAQKPDFVAFESGPVRPLALLPDGSRLFITNIPDGRIEVFHASQKGLEFSESIAVGLEPVAVNPRNDSEVWVVNHLSDSVSVIDVSSIPGRIKRTLLVGDEARDVVFGGENRSRAFVTTAHRGQNSPVDLDFYTPGVGRADVWVFDADDLGLSPGGDATTILQLFSDGPRALAATPDGSRVYAAAFYSGNQTSIVNPDLICKDPFGGGPCEVQPPGAPSGLVSPGSLPPPNENVGGVAAPHVALIVRWNPESEAFEDELGRSWRSVMPFTLADQDVFEIDAMADPPVTTKAFTGVGTVIYNMAVNPASGKIYVSNTEAFNEVRFEPSVVGHQHESRVTVIDPASGTVEPRHLNKHIDYNQVPSTEGVRQKSLSLPLNMVVSQDGNTLYVAAFGSGKIGVFDTAKLEDDSFEPSASDHIKIEGGGVAGLALDEERERLYAHTRFDNAVVVIDLVTRREIQRVPLHNPEPQHVVQGRPFLYDATLTSSNGEASCATCHVFGHWDALAWDLGDPNAPLTTRSLPTAQALGELVELPFHPLKGPMTTQSLRGMKNHGAMHWRGDRVGEEPFDSAQAFKTFNPPFVSLLGRDQQLSDAEMQVFTDFMLDVIPPPNPNRNLDNSLTEAQQAGADEFFREDACLNCHRLDPNQRIFGTIGLFDGNALTDELIQQVMKIPQLRNLYDKVGSFNFTLGIEPGDSLGPQVRGFGSGFDGATPVLPLGTVQQPHLNFLMVFPSNMNPIVGQQITASNTMFSAVEARIDLLMERAQLGECDLVVSGVIDEMSRSWLMTEQVTFQPDSSKEAAVTHDSLVQQIESGAVLTYSCVPPGSGLRIALDRDRDGFFNADERAVRADPASVLNTPRTGCLGDCDGSEAVTVDEIIRAVGIALGNEPIDVCYRFDPDADEMVTVDEIIGGIASALDGCS